MIVEAGKTDHLAEAYRARLIAELERADSECPDADRIGSSGDPSASVMVVKGSPGPSELEGGTVLSGPDGEALAKAFEVLGRDTGDSYAVLSRPVADCASDRVASRLRRIIEACDPVWIVALDAEAAEDVARAFDLPTPRTGEPERLFGRDVLVLEGLEASLADDALKRRVWAQMQPLSISSE